MPANPTNVPLMRCISRAEALSEEHSPRSIVYLPLIDTREHLNLSNRSTARLLNMSTSDGPATTAASTSADTLHTAADSDSAFSGCMNGYRIFLAAELKADHQEMATEIVKVSIWV